MGLLVGVCGGIAAYKAADLVSTAKKSGWDVRVMMTPSATKFIGAVTLEALSQFPVLTDVLACSPTENEPSAIDHIAWAKWAEVLCVAPATASTLAKFSNGFADDALSAVWLATPPDTPKVICPAMNTHMWNHPAVQENIERIMAVPNTTIVEPIEKRLACGDEGIGGLADTETILGTIQSLG